jgi:hypothetical protein
MCHHDGDPVVTEPTGGEGQRAGGLRVDPLHVVDGDEQRRTGRLGRQQAERRRADQEPIAGTCGWPPAKRRGQRLSLHLG